jgi:hypothetical protein
MERRGREGERTSQASHYQFWSQFLPSPRPDSVDNQEAEEERGGGGERTCCKVCVLSSSLSVEATRVARGESPNSSRVRSSERIEEVDARCGRRSETKCCLEGRIGVEREQEE